MRPYTNTDNAPLCDSTAPTDTSTDDNWPTLEQVEFHRRNAEIIRSEALGETALITLAFIRNAWRKLRGLPAKLRTDTVKPGATA